MKVFITGGSGFLGRNLIRALIARGDTVKALARSTESAEIIESLGAEVVAGDVNDDQALRTGMTDCELVIHAAAIVNDWGEPANFHRVNVTGTSQVLDACRAAHVERMIHISTEAVLADGKPIINADETYPYARRPAGLYPLTKSLAEKAVIAANSIELETVVVRPRFIWGKDDTALLPQLMEAVTSGRYLWMSGGHYLTSTCHVDNAVEGILLAAHNAIHGEIYFLTDGAPVEFCSFVTEMLKTQGITIPDRSIPTGLLWRVAQLGEIAIRLTRSDKYPPVTRTTVALMGHEVTVNDKKAREKLGYVGHVTREVGLAQMAKLAQTKDSVR